MRSGFEGIAEARFARPTQDFALQYDMAHMHTLVRVDVSEQHRPHLQMQHEKELEDEEKEERKKHLPIRWFAPHQGMKKAEKHFVESLQIVMECVDLLMETQRLCNEFEEGE